MAAKSTTARGLGWAHQKQRARLEAAHRNGTPCWWCGQPMYRDQDAHLNPDGHVLNADHSNPRANGGTQADRMMHDTCNKSRQAGKRDDERPAILAAKGGHTPNALDWGA